MGVLVFCFFFQAEAGIRALVRSRGLGDVYERLCEVYAERFALPDGRIPVTFEILTLTAWAPDASQPKPLRPGSAQTRLADALGVPERKLPDE